MAFDLRAALGRASYAGGGQERVVPPIVGPALELLEGIAAAAPAAEQPAGLTEQIENVRRRLERLKLEEFFP